MAPVNEPDWPYTAAGETAREDGEMGRLRRISTRSTAQPNPSVLPHLCKPSIFALLGVCAYIVGFILPLPWHLSLIILALMSALAILSGSRHRTPAWSPLTIAMVAFLASVGLSTLVSEDIGRSMRLSAAFLPGILLFMVVADHFEGLREIRLLYVTFSAIALALAVVVLWGAWQGHGVKDLRAWVFVLGSPSSWWRMICRFWQ
jgi:hypothetical protein